MPAENGTIVTETLDYDGGRDVTLYLPSQSPQAVIFTGDSQLIPHWGDSIAATTVCPTMIVGVHRAANETVRLQEYSPSFNPTRFAAHEQFLVKTVRDYVRAGFGLTLSKNRTAIFGVSAGGELALSVGLRRPDIFGVILCASPGAGYRPPQRLPSPPPRAYFVAGKQEPFFRENAVLWADTLRAAGADVVLTLREGGHGDDFWRSELPLMAAWAFGRGR